MITTTTTLKQLQLFQQSQIFLLPLVIVVTISCVSKSSSVLAQGVLQDLSCNAPFELAATATNDSNSTTTTTSQCEPYLENGICDSELSWQPKSECERADCKDCSHYCSQLSYDCVGCLSNGCYWCPGDGTCHNSDLYYAHLDPNEKNNEEPLRPRDRGYSCYKSDDYIRTGILVLDEVGEDQSSASTTTRSSTTKTISSIEAIEEQCTKPENHFTDPLYTATKWIFDMIDIVPVWERGLYGTGVRVRINDNGMALDHVEFENRIDRKASCDNGNYVPSSSHGTFVASIVGAAANNGVCTVGISPNVTLSTCNAFNLTLRYNVLGANLDQMDISTNSWGTSACFKSRRRRQRKILRKNRRLQLEELDDDGDDDNDDHSDETAATTNAAPYCPFSYENVFVTSPCEDCNFTTDGSLDVDIALRSRCESRIATYCSRFYEHDPIACAEFIDLLVNGGECEYNTLQRYDRDALIAGITDGRDGKGIIYVFAAGNDYHRGADTNFEGLINTRLTISVGSVGKDGLHASYSTPGAALFISGPGGDNESRTNFIAASAGGMCTEAGAGTSYSCPVVSGVVALMLEANPNLTWRDVQGILAKTSRTVTNDPDDDSLITNAAGYSHSNLYGFGIVNANLAAREAETWKNFSPEQILEVSSGLVNVPILDKSPATPSTSAISTVTLPYDNFEFVSSMQGFFTESVVILLDLRHFSRGDLDVILTSPSGTRSVLHPGKRPETTQLDIDERWKLMTVRSWGESPFGTWSLNVTDIKHDDVAECADHLWSIEVEEDDDDDGELDVTCEFFEILDYCADGEVNDELLEQVGGMFIYNVTDEDFGLNFEEACCACGGGRRRGDDGTEDMVVQWRLVVYGHPMDTKNSLVPSDTPSFLPSVSPTDTPSMSPQPAKIPTAPSPGFQDPLQDQFPNLAPFRDVNTDDAESGGGRYLILNDLLIATMLITASAISLLMAL